MKTFFLFLFLTSSQFAQAENLLVNGGFDSDLSGWTIKNAAGAISWSNIDEFNQPDSGSLRMEESGEFGPWVEQCVNIDPAIIPSLSIRHFMPETVTSLFAAVYIELIGYPVANSCTGSTLYRVSNGLDNDGAHEWRSLSVKGEAGASSVAVWIYVVGPGSTDYVAHIDNVFLGDRQFADGFESPPGKSIGN